MDSNSLCECGSRSKRYRSSTNHWICNKCKKETLDYTHPDAFIKVQVNWWWGSLPMEKRIEMYLKDKQNKQLNEESTKENINSCLCLS